MGAVVAWASPATLTQRSSEICIWVSTKLATFALTSLMFALSDDLVVFEAVWSWAKLTLLLFGFLS
ncbi:hypothetical protein HMPREF2844_04230 [Neisseria sp. HMSC072F04]|nr:hypothetical protein HMPREF2844_04230 [Neisseria sp. HMSC072F04]